MLTKNMIRVAFWAAPVWEDKLEASQLYWDYIFIANLFEGGKDACYEVIC